MRFLNNPWIVPGLAVLGLADASYLAMLHFRREIPPCLGYSGCAEVNSSPYAEVFGVPIAALGAVLYLAILGVALWRVRDGGNHSGHATLALYGLTLSGALFMAYLTAVELFVLHAICYWCIFLAVVTLLLLILAIRDVRSFGAEARPPRGLPAHR